MNENESVVEAINKVKVEIQKLRRDIRACRSGKHGLTVEERKAMKALWNKRQTLLWAEKEFIGNIKDQTHITPRQYFWFIDLCEDYSVNL